MSSFKHWITAATVILLGLVASLALGGLTTPASAAAATRYVATTGSDGANDCSVSTSPCQSIQHAVDVAERGDEILIAGGTYTGVSARPGHFGGVVTQTVHLTKSVTLRGGFSSDFAQRPNGPPTVLDAGGKGRVIYAAGNITPTIEMLWITGGNALGLGGSGAGDTGGGMYSAEAAATLSDCRVISNTAAGWGGGLFTFLGIAGTETMIVRTRFEDNYAGDGGGGVFLYGSNATISRSSFVSNTARWNGGGLYVRSSPATVAENIFDSNVAASFDGGAMYVFDSPALVAGNVIQRNHAQNRGGGMTLHGGAPRVDSNTVVSNTAGGRGGGVNIWRSTAATLNANLVISNTSGGEGGGISISTDEGAPLTPTLTNTVIVGNQAAGTGSAIYAQAASARFWQTTIARNTGGTAVYAASDAGQHSRIALTNTILVSQTSLAAIEGWPDGRLLLDGLLLDGNWTFTNVDVFHGLKGDASFAADGYHITGASGAVDMALPTSVSDDIDGRHRPVGRPDLGAHEWGGRVYLPVVVRQPAGQ